MKIIMTMLILLPLILFGQNKDTVLRYLNENLELTTKNSAVYMGVSVKQQDKWFLYALYPDTTPLLKAYYKDKALKIKDGPFVSYYPKNIKATQGTYFQNRMYGVWQSWYPNGTAKDSGAIKGDIFVGRWKSWYANGQLMLDCFYKDSLSPELIRYLGNNKSLMAYVNGIRHGPTTKLYKNGKTEATGNFENNQMIGEWQWYHENGQLSTKEVYANGKLTTLTCFDSTGKETGDYCSLSKPAVLKRYGDYKAYIYQNLTWPEEAKKKRIEGDVRISFHVSKKGQLENLTVTSDFPVLQKAVQELFTSMAEWYPAVSHNRIIDWDEEFIIPFRLPD